MSVSHSQPVHDALRRALFGLNDAIDLYWSEGRTDGQVKNICYWQFKAKEALALPEEASTAAGEWLPVALYPDDDSIVLVANPDEGRLPVVAWKVEDKWFRYDLSEREPLDPQPTIWTEWPKLPKASSVSRPDSNTQAD